MNQITTRNTKITKSEYSFLGILCSVCSLWLSCELFLRSFVALHEFFDRFVEVRVEFLGAVEFLVFGGGFGLGGGALHGAEVFQNPVFVEGEKFVHAGGEGFHAKGLSPLDDAFNVVEEGGDGALELFDVALGKVVLADESVRLEDAAIGCVFEGFQPHVGE